jgi:cobalt-zinc-cadmium efflux system membrane fusion protein
MIEKRLPFVLFTLFAAAGLTGCGDEAAPVRDAQATTAGTVGAPQAAADPMVRLGEDEARRAGIRVQRITLEARRQQVMVTATIEPNRDRLAHVAPRVPGRLVQVNAALGDVVRPGQALAILDSIDLGEARASYLQARSEAAVAAADLSRAQRLQAEHIMADKEVLRIRSGHAKASAALRAATDRLRMLGVDPQRSSGSTFPLQAPFAGTVIEKEAVLGELAAVDRSLFTVADLSVLWIEADLFERDLSRIAIGAPVRVTVAAYPGAVFTGRLTYVSSMMDSASRTIKARVEVANPDGRLKLAMFASAAIEAGETIKALMLPEQAVLLVQGQPTVFVAQGEAYRPQAVEPGERIGDRVTIASGLVPGDVVAIGGAYALKAALLKSQLGEAD